MARGKHLFPFRTEQLSPSAPMVLGSQGPGRVGRRRFFLKPRLPGRRGFLYLGPRGISLRHASPVRSEPGSMEPGGNERARRWRFVVVPHTHWDREWYRPFEYFQLRLGRVVDDMLDVLERDPEFTSFTLDGQAIVLEDYVDVRPE